MAGAVYLPLHCRACSRIRLEQVRPGEPTRCRDCGEPASIVPSESYSAHDVPLFEKIEGAFRQARLSRRELMVTLASTGDVELRARAPDSVLLRVLDQLPQLHFLLPSLYGVRALPFDRVALTRAIGMLRTMIATRLSEP